MTAPEMSFKAQWAAMQKLLRECPAWELTTLKKVQTCRGREGDAWSAEVYFNKKKVAVASNSGNGGETTVDLLVGGQWASREARATDPTLCALAEALPPAPEWEAIRGIRSMEPRFATLTYLVEALVDETLLQKDLQREVKKATRKVTALHPDGRMVVWACTMAQWAEAGAAFQAKVREKAAARQGFVFLPDETDPKATAERLLLPVLRGEMG